MQMSLRVMKNNSFNDEIHKEKLKFNDDDKFSIS